MSQPPADTRPGWSTRRKVWTIVGVIVAVVVVLGAIGGIFGAPAPKPDPTAASAAPTTTEPAPPTTEVAPPSIVEQTPAAPPPPAANVPAAKPRPTSLAEIDTALSPAEKREYAANLRAVAPSIQGELDKHPGDLDAAAKYLARDGVQLCNTIASGESDDVVNQQTVSRFEIDPSDAAAVRSTTEKMVCPKLG